MIRNLEFSKAGNLGGLSKFNNWSEKMAIEGTRLREDSKNVLQKWKGYITG